MKSFILKLFVFFLLLFCIDCVSGVIFRYLVENPKGGDTARNNYIVNEAREEILIFGSSRAMRHYNPLIIQDSLGASCYNCAQDGCGIILSYGRYQVIKRRYQPRLVIYDIFPSFDYVEGLDNHRYITWLKAYYNQKGVPEVIWSVDKTEKYKMYSKMYQYNSKWIQLLGDYIHPMQPKDIQGYRYLTGVMKKTKQLTSSKPKTSAIKIDPLKWGYLQKMIDEVGMDRIILTISPIWSGMSLEQYSPIEELCKEKGISFLNFANHPKYLYNNSYFKDQGHLNKSGSEEYTRDLVEELKKKGFFAK